MDCGLGIKHGLGIKRGLQAADWVSGVEAESGIMNHTYKTCKNLESLF